MAFSSKKGTPPHYQAFANDPRSGSQTFLGLAFWTTELEPLQRGTTAQSRCSVKISTRCRGRRSRLAAPHAVRNSARRVAGQLLTPPGTPKRHQTSTRSVEICQRERGQRRAGRGQHVS